MDILSESCPVKHASNDYVPKFLNIDCFHLEEGTALIPLEHEFRNLFPIIGETKKIVRIYGDKNQHTDFKLTEQLENDDCIDYYLRCDDEHGVRDFVCYTTLQDSNDKILQPYKMDKYLIKALKRFWKRHDESIQANFDKIKYYEKGSCRKRRITTRTNKFFESVVWV